MKIVCTTGKPEQIKSDVVVVFELQGRKTGDALKKIDSAMVTEISRIMKVEKYEPKLNSLLVINTFGRIKSGKIIVAGLGKEEKYTTESLRCAIGSAMKKARSVNAKSVVAVLPEIKSVSGFESAKAITEGGLLGLYEFKKYKTEKEDDKKIETLRICVDSAKTKRDAERGVRIGEILCSATALARDLITEPANYIFPEKLADIAKGVAKKSGLKCRIYDERAIKKMKMGALLGVSAGSAKEPRFVHLTYEPKSRHAKTVAMIGKGITFDSGGLSLKPSNYMDDMKTDMSGAGVVLSVMSVLKKLSVKTRVEGIMPLTENMPSGSAIKPGDVVKSMSGKTVEVMNTDAEGRLILADALNYASNLKPDEVIDLATLTGACVIALGERIAGIMGNSEKLISDLIATGDKCGEKLWQLPLFEDYKDMIKSDIADMKNIGEPREAGAIIGGLFLQNFADKNKWAHIDIAGPSRYSKDYAYIPKGASGFGVRLLLNYLIG